MSKKYFIQEEPESKIGRLTDIRGGYAVYLKVDSKNLKMTKLVGFFPDKDVAMGFRNELREAKAKG